MKKIIATGRTERGQRKKLTIDGETYTRSRIQRRPGTNPVTVIPLDMAAAFGISPGETLLAWRQIDDKRATVVFLSPDDIAPEHP